MSNFNKYVHLVAGYVKPTTLSILVYILICIPFYSFCQQNIDTPLIYLYSLSTYFIAIIAISISYYHYFLNEWKTKVTDKILLFNFVLDQTAVSFFFYLFNSIFGISTDSIYLLFIMSLVSCVFFLWFDAELPTRPFSFWIFRSFDGKALTFTKKMNDPALFKRFVRFLSPTSNKITIDNTILICNGILSNKPAYFINYNKESNIVEMQIAKQKGFSFAVNDRINNLKELFVLFGFEHVGIKDINSSLFVANRDYPKFTKSKKFLSIWLIFGALILATNVANNKLELFNYVTLYISYQIYYPFNSFISKNPGLSLIIAAILGGIISHPGKIKSFLDAIYQQFKEM